MKKKITSYAVCLAMSVSVFTGFSAASPTAQATTYKNTARLMERLNRGLIAVKTTADTRGQTVNGVYLSWRLLGTESLENQAFDIYRDDKKIYTTGVHDATCYTDTAGTVNNKYKVVKAGEDPSLETAVTPTDNNVYAKPSEVGNGNSLKNSFSYVDIPIQRPDPVKRAGDGKTSYYYTYSGNEGGANDGSISDLDGDGDYEIVLKWDPTDSKDSAGADYTGNVYIDAYELDPNNTGYKWRIDLGPNVTAGAHYTQFMVYDFDGDGQAEVAMQTAPGSKDGLGNYVSAVGDTAEIRNVDNTKLYIGTSGGSKGKNLGPEYYTIFDGDTGAALCTTAAIPLVSSGIWGDSKYNRAERFLAGVAYLDGVHPSYITCRGYYARAVIRAYTWDGDSLSLQWEYTGSKSGSNSLYGQGNHNLSIADIDDDGCDEIIYGSAALDNDGKTILGNTRLGHGDAIHTSDFNNDGRQETYSIKEEKAGYKTYASDLRDPLTGKHFFDSGKITTSDDNGRGVMENIDDEYAKTHDNAPALFWDSGHSTTFDFNGDTVATKPSTAGSGSFDNSVIYWDGDLSRELLDSNIIQKYDASTGYTKRFYGPLDGYTLVGGTTNNYSKRNATLSADIWGDWREEIILPINKSADESGNVQPAALRVYTSTMPTTYRLTTLMHDSQYRTNVAIQNVGYNQPPHTSYYIGSKALATDSNGNTLNYLDPKTPFTKVIYDLNPVAVTGVSLSTDNIEVERTNTTTVTANIEPSNATKKGIIWSSDDESIAEVANGIITGKGNGTTTITAKTKDGRFTASCKVTVYSVPVTGINFVSDTLNLGTGNSKQIYEDVLPENATNKNVIWRSYDESVAKVDKGVVTGISKGTTVVSATTEDGNFLAICSVGVFDMVTTDETDDESFVSNSSDSKNTFALTPSSASITMSDSESGAEVSKSFTRYDNDYATLSFKLTTGGQKYDETNWNWTGHSYTLGLQLTDEDNTNLLRFTQSYNESAGITYVQTASEDEVDAKSWTVSGSSDNPFQRSFARWLVTAEFDYNTDTCKTTVQGCDKTWTPNISYTHTFNLNGVKFANLKCYTTVDNGCTVKAAPSLEEVKYERTTTNGSVDKPDPNVTAPPTPSPTPEIVPINTDVTKFTSVSRVTAVTSGDEITFTNAENANNGVAYAYADISNIINNQDKYEIDYDSYLPYTSRVKIELADLSQRPGTTSKTVYDMSGVAVCHGVVDSSSYALNNDKTSGNAPAARDAWVHTKISVNAAEKTLSILITDESGNTLISKSGISYTSAPTGIAYVDWINSIEAKMKNIKVTTYKEKEQTKDIEISEPTISGETISVSVTNNTNSDMSAKLAAAVYDSNGKLLSVSLSDASSVAAGSTTVFMVDKPNGTYKLMLWNTSNQAPLQNAVEMN